MAYALDTDETQILPEPEPCKKVFVDHGEDAQVAPSPSPTSMPAQRTGLYEPPEPVGCDEDDGASKHALEAHDGAGKDLLAPQEACGDVKNKRLFMFFGD